MLGEADFHSPEEKAQLAAHAPAEQGQPIANEIMSELDTVTALISAGDLAAAKEKILSLKPKVAQMIGGERPKGLSMLGNGGGGYSDTRALTLMALPSSQSYPSSP